MSGRASANLSNLSKGKKSASVLKLARTRGTGPRTDPSGREGRKDWNRDQMEAENRELRDQAIELMLQIQALRHPAGPQTHLLAVACPNGMQGPWAVRVRRRIGG